jgi:hypothetical protein
MLDHKGDRRTVTASFVVGCDGAHSAVRHLLKIPFAGAEYKDSFVLADVDTNDAVPASELLLCPSKFGPVAIFPMSATRRRIIASIAEPEGDAPSLDLVKRILAQRAPATVKASAMHWSSYFRIHHRHVEKMRVGRIFIAGDAAHIHSPFGGQGMNTGLHDVWNLAWKLELFLRGHGNEQLLDSYNTERLPIIEHVIELTDMMTKVLGTPNKLAQALRDTIIPMVSRLAPFQHGFVQRLSELGIAYPNSPIIEGPGERYFDDSMRRGGINERFLLIVNRAEANRMSEVLKHFSKSFNEIVELRSNDHRGITLVRPDGYVAFTAHSINDSSLSSLRLLLERQISVSS